MRFFSFVHVTHSPLLVRALMVGVALAASGCDTSSSDDSNPTANDAEDWKRRHGTDASSGDGAVTDAAIDSNLADANDGVVDANANATDAGLADATAPDASSTVVVTDCSKVTCFYVRPGSGGGSGTDWTSAFGSLPNTLQRGAVYFMAAGTYSGRTFDEPTSGTTPITLKKATDSDHGTDTGWSSSYGAGQAVFPGGGVAFSSDYWVFEGSVGSGGDPHSYGFYFTPPNSGSTIRPIVYDGSYVQIRHAAVTCPGPSGDIQQFGFSGQGDFVTTDHTYVNNCQVSYWNQGSDNVISNSYMGTYWSSSANHGVHVEQILRPSFFNNLVTFCNIQCIEPGGGSTTNIEDGKYYNNVFVNVTGTNGILKGTSSGAIINTVIYGNTFINVSGPILYQNNWGLGYGSGNVIINNMLYNSPNLCEEAGGGTISHSYNAFFDSGSVSETGAQIGTGDPFVDYVNGNYHLKAATEAGLTLPSPYDVDITGAVRGADGIWDRGAYEY